MARQGLELTNARSTLTHTTKALFALLTGRYPSISHDIVETVPVDKPYASLATILKKEMGLRTAFFQSAKGAFEARAGLVHNLGFDTFWAREDLNDTNAFIGYLACDEFSMLRPIAEWIKSKDSPFLLVILCSVSHDAYEVPRWFAKPAEKPVERYEQAVRYTDSFIAAVDNELARLNLTEQTIFCVVGDHGEAFGEHGRFGHEGMAFDEVLRVPFVLRSPSLIEAGVKTDKPVGSIDLTPTLLALSGLDISSAGFAGVSVLSGEPVERKLYFSAWMDPSPAGFIKNGRKFVFDPVNNSVFAFDLRQDPAETRIQQLSRQRALEIATDIAEWRQKNTFAPNQQPAGRRMLFDHWLCCWNNRNCDASYCR
jgi:phosphoglycerol transferase MdoB-like AlkP superfamily enzyme